MIDNKEQLIGCWFVFKDNINSIEISEDTISFVFDKEEEIKNFKDELSRYSIELKSFSKKNIEITFDKAKFCIEKNEDTFLDLIRRKFDILKDKDVFIFNFRKGYFFYDHHSKIVTSSSSTDLNNYVNHLSQYKTLLDIFLLSTCNLVELNLPTATSNELIVVSRGDEKLITNIKYEDIDREIVDYSFVELPLNSFTIKLAIEEWLVCFKNTLCQFMESQSDSRKTFGWVYNEFEYIFNLADKNYNLYLSKFSFDKIRKQFRAEKDQYFDNLNDAQNKIVNQIISVPLTIGAGVVSSDYIDGSEVYARLLNLALLLYISFVIYSLIMYLYDVKKIRSNLNQEENNIKQHFPDLYKGDFQIDFAFLKNKIIRVRILGISILFILCVLALSLSLFHDLGLLYCILFI